MKITKSQLIQIIKEELANVIVESDVDNEDLYRRWPCYPDSCPTEWGGIHADIANMALAHKRHPAALTKGMWEIYRHFEEDYDQWWEKVGKLEAEKSQVNEAAKAITPEMGEDIKKLGKITKLIEASANVPHFQAGKVLDQIRMILDDDTEFKIGKLQPPLSDVGV